MNQLALKIATVGLVASTAALPMASYAQYRDTTTRRQQQKNQWRNIAYGAAALGALGVLKKNSTLTAAGALGAAYSAYRYEQDRKAQNRYRGTSGYYGYRTQRYSPYSSYNRTRSSSPYGYNSYGGYRRGDDDRYERHDNGRHLGWYKGKGNKHRRDDD